MADIKWPTGLRGPLLSTYSRSETVGFIESDLASGPAFVELVSDDNPTTHSVTYQLSQSQARAFQAWLKLNKVKTLSPWFDGPIPNEDGETQYQECRYTTDGYPQLTGITTGGIHTYQAAMISREIVSVDDGYEEAFMTIFELGNGDYDSYASEFDRAMNNWS